MFFLSVQTNPQAELDPASPTGKDANAIDATSLRGIQLRFFLTIGLFLAPAWMNYDNNYNHCI